MNDIGLLVLGWLFGMLSPEIVYQIRAARRMKHVERGILTEVKDLALRIVCAAARIEELHGLYGRAHVQWVRDAYIKFGRSDKHDDAVEVLNKILALSDADLEAARLSKQSEGGSLGLRRYRLPFIDAKINELELFGPERMARLLDLRAQVEQFNELCDEARSYLRMTFEVTGNNHQIVTKNLTGTYEHARKKARQIAEIAEAIIEVPRPEPQKRAAVVDFPQGGLK